MPGKKTRKSLVPHEDVIGRILFLRGEKVMIDRDLADLYGVSTKVLNQAVKRNSGRFPDDFMFQLTQGEKEEVVTNCDHLKNLKFSPQLPYVFTEQGVAMLSSVLNSETAISANIQIMRAFTRLRKMLVDHEDLRRKLLAMEQKYDGQFKVVFEAIRQLIAEPVPKQGRLGFRPDKDSD